MEKIIEHIISTMLAKGVIEEKQKAVIAYGLDLLLSTVISMTVLVVIGNVLGQGMQTICFLIPLVLFQGFGGYPILVIAPVQNPRAPFSEGFGRQMHRIVVWIYVGCWAVAGGFHIFMGDARAVLSAVILSGISIFCTYWHNAKLVKDN